MSDTEGERFLPSVSFDFAHWLSCSLIFSQACRSAASPINELIPSVKGKPILPEKIGITDKVWKEIRGILETRDTCRPESISYFKKVLAARWKYFL